MTRPRLLDIGPREYSQLYFLVAAIVNAPEKTAELISSADELSDQRGLIGLRVVLRSMQRGFSGIPRPKNADLRRVAERLVSGTAQSGQLAGRALMWAIENRGRRHA